MDNLVNPFRLLDPALAGSAGFQPWLFPSLKEALEEAFRGLWRTGKLDINESNMKNTLGAIYVKLHNCKMNIKNQ